MKPRGKMGYLSAVMALGVLGLMSSASFAAPATAILYQGDYSSGQGGEFTAYMNLADFYSPGAVKSQNLSLGAGAAYGDAYLVGQTGIDNFESSTAIFQTFCVQAGLNNVYFTPGTTYTATIGTSQTNSNNPPPPFVTGGTGYLFDQFWNKTLSGYNFTNGSGPLTRKESAGALQAAIWYLEGDFANLADGYGEAGIGSDGAAQAQASTWVSAANAYVSGGGPNIGAVQFLIIQNGSYAQAQLIEVPGGAPSPVPLPAAAAIGFSMLGGFGALFGVRKRLSRRPRIA